jgi:hypothetical protein
MAVVPTTQKKHCFELQKEVKLLKEMKKKGKLIAGFPNEMDIKTKMAWEEPTGTLQNEMEFLQRAVRALQRCE